MLSSSSVVLFVVNTAVPSLAVGCGDLPLLSTTSLLLPFVPLSQEALVREARRQLVVAVSMGHAAMLHAALQGLVTFPAVKPQTPPVASGAAAASSALSSTGAVARPVVVAVYHRGAATEAEAEAEVGVGEQGVDIRRWHDEDLLQAPASTFPLSTAAAAAANAATAANAAAAAANAATTAVGVTNG